MSPPFPLPAIQPFERLNAIDGLLINADRWKRAHDYHRQRQNLHYQSLNQPGIVCGLGVRPIPAPGGKGRSRQQSWVQVQPGLAIDLRGNVIVIPQAFDYQIKTALTDSEPLTVYLVASYRDPDELQRTYSGETIQETYRLEEITRPPGPLEVELCRFLLPPGPVALSLPDDVFFPGYNQIDLRYRTFAQARPQAQIQLAQVKRDDPDYARHFFRLTDLLHSLHGLYPALSGADAVAEVRLDAGIETLSRYDLLYLTGQQPLALTTAELNALQAYLTRGGVLLVDCSPTTALTASVQALAQQWHQPLQPLARHHPLRTRPFLFSALPRRAQQPIQVFVGGGIVLVIGDIAASWGLDDDLNLERGELRTAQEWGVNLLHYASRRRQLTDWQQPQPAERG